MFGLNTTSFLVGLVVGWLVLPMLMGAVSKAKSA